MQSMSLVDIDTPYGASYIYINGQIELIQKSLISSGTMSRLTYNNNIITNITSPIDYNYLNKEYNERNLTTPLKYDKLIMPFTSNSNTEIEIDITIPFFQTIM